MILSTSGVSARLRARGIEAPGWLVRRVLDRHFAADVVRVGLARSIDERLLPKIEALLRRHRRRQTTMA